MRLDVHHYIHFVPELEVVGKLDKLLTQGAKTMVDIANIKKDLEQIKQAITDRLTELQDKINELQGKLDQMEPVTKQDLIDLDTATENIKADLGVAPDPVA